MGDIIDLDNLDNYNKCKDVKLAVIWINIIGAPLSFILLVISIIRMILTKKILTFLTHIIILIFFSEIMNTISEMLQLLKYNYKDTRNSNNNNEETERGIICQIQIVLSIISDFGSLLGTLLVSIRCNDVILNRKKFFDKKKVQCFSIIIIILSTIIFSISFLLIDRKLTSDSSFKYDKRDRCNYWCWLDHVTSTICYMFYMILVFLNLFFGCKAYCVLKREYDKLYEQNLVLIPRSNSINLEDKNENENDKEYQSKMTRKNSSAENSARIKELRLMKMKIFIYPWVTIFIWVLLLIYRMLDVIVIEHIDYNNEEEKEIEEKKYFEENPGLRRLYQSFLILHTILSSIRGIIYSLIFIIFEEKVFWDCFRRCVNCFCCCCKLNIPEDLEKDEEKFIRNTYTSLTDRNTENTEEYINGRKSNTSITGKNGNMNTSDYHYN